MNRAGSKSRVDKAGRTTSLASAAQSANEIIPGKFTESDWLFMLEKDDDETYVTDIVSEVVNNALSIIHYNYIEKQLVPFTVSQAKDALTQLVEWLLITRDEGESSAALSSTWITDVEPTAAIIDSWATGAVPVQVELSRTTTPGTELTDRQECSSVVMTVLSASPVPPVIEPQPPVDAQDRPTRGGMKPTKDMLKPRRAQLPREKDSEDKTRAPFEPHRGKLKSAKVRAMTETLFETEEKIKQLERQSSERLQTADEDTLKMPAASFAVLKAQVGRPPGAKDVLYDEKGNVVSVAKINPDQLPTNRVRTGFKIVDPGEISLTMTSRKGASMLASHGRGGANKSRTVTLVNRRLDTELTNQSLVLPVAASILQAVQPAPGVLFREGDQHKQGPVIGESENELLQHAQSSLRPLRQFTPEGDKLNVKELLDAQSPTVKPMKELRPMPPISPSQSQTAC